MKKFDFPEDYKKSFIPAVMLERMRNNLEHFKDKKPFYEYRERANTAYELSNKLN